GTRWVSVIKLSTSWKQYTLLPEDFKFWDGSPSRSGTALDTAKSVKLSFELAEGITRQKTGIRHEYFVSDIRLVRDEYKDSDFQPLILESLSPSYKTFKTKASKVTAFDTGKQIASDVDIVCPIPRSMGFGSDAVRSIREIPVLNTLNGNGQITGTAAHILLNATSEYAGSIWGYAGFSQEWLNKHADAAIPHLVSMMKRINRGFFLANAGTNRFGYVVGEPIKIGAAVINYNLALAKAIIDVKISANRHVFYSKRFDASISSGITDSSLDLDTITSLPRGEYTITTSLQVDGKSVDCISYQFNVVEYPSLTSVNTVNVDDGDFMLNGKKWYPLGINYFPRYSPAQEVFLDMLRWLSPAQYNLLIVEQDLKLAQSLGMNLLSISYIRPDESGALIDFMARAERRGIKINVYVPGLHPIWRDFATADAMIKTANLHKSPNVFAYDLGIEVHMGNYAERKQFDYRWQDWVKQRYQSLEDAYQDWGYEPESVDGFITGPSDDQLMQDGVWRIYVAAYRRFWDDEVSKGYRLVREHLRTLDARHLLGAKSGWAGTGSMWAVAGFQVDLLSGAKHLDFISPEAYNLNGGPDDFLKGGLSTAYSRAVSGGKPVFWAEFGSPTGANIPAMKYSGYSLEMLDDQVQYFRNTIRMVYDISANGATAWWWPVGYRVDEKSDYGIVNPDLTLRPAALEFPKIAPKFSNPRDAREPDIYLTVDRDAHVTGYAGIYAQFADGYVKLFKEGKFPGVKTSGTGTTSADTPLVAVGNVPYNGKNPPKYLNAEFNSLMVNGRPVKDGDRVEVSPGTPIRIEASVGNTAEAKWLAPGASDVGAVYLSAMMNGVETLVPIKADTPFLADALSSGEVVLPSTLREAECSFRMTAKGRMNFGEVTKITFIVK
ncbi:MAG: beta-galactosidase, partial [Armatimonadota bacterium]